MNKSEHIGAVILAAGSSSRLGEPKQLVTFRDKPLLQKVIDLCAPLNLSSQVIVLGANSDAIQEGVDPGKFNFVLNEEWSEGIAGSIRKGVAYSLELNPECRHLMILLSDQPFVSTELLQKLLKAHITGTKEITASLYKGDTGVPAIFSKSIFPLLMELKGDQGAKKIMKQFPDKVASVPFEMGYFDVDTPEDQAELRKFES